MVAKAAQYRIQGMNRDVSESVSNADKSEALFKYAYEIKNMRILTNDTNNNSLVLVNENTETTIKGFAPIISIKYAVIQN